MPLCYLGAATDGQNFRPYPALPFSRAWQSKIVFPVSHPNLAFLSYLSRRIFTYGHEAWCTGSYIEVWLKITITFDSAFIQILVFHVGFRFLTLQISFHFVGFRFLTLKISFHFVGFRFLTWQISLDFVLFRFVSFRFSVYQKTNYNEKKRNL
jgi:hypothetical protein